MKSHNRTFSCLSKYFLIVIVVNYCSSLRCKIPYNDLSVDMLLDTHSWFMDSTSIPLLFHCGLSFLKISFNSYAEDRWSQKDGYFTSVLQIITIVEKMKKQSKMFVCTI